MRKEVKRSLLLWPALASAAITTASWVSMEFPAFIDSAFVAATTERPITLTADKRATSSFAAEIGSRAPSIADRNEFGGRSVRLPERVAEVFGQGKRLPMLAPKRTEQQELAGLSLQLSTPQNNSNLIAEGACIVSEFPLAEPTLQSLRNRSRVIQATSPIEVVIDEDAIALIEPSLSIQPAAKKSSLPASNRALAKPARIQQPVAETLSLGDPSQSYVTDLPQIKMDARTNASTKRSASDWPAGWPVTSQLDTQLQSLTNSFSDPEVRVWTERTTSLLSQLRTLPRLGDAAAGGLIEQLEQLADQGKTDAELMSDRDCQVAWLRVAHAVDRRVKVWRPVWEITRDSEMTWMVTDQPVDSAVAVPSDEMITAAIRQVRSELVETGDEAGWAAYLLLDEIESVATAKYRDVAKREERSIVAQRLLSRLSWHALQETHLNWLERDSVRGLADAVRPWARGAVDYADLMSQIERQESDAIDLAAIDIADAVQTLRFADNPAAVRIADSVGTYYRNANVRLAISQDMLTRMLPTMEPKSVPVNTMMMGARIRGTSQIDSNLAIVLTPSNDHWSLQLQTLGNVTTRSTGYSGPVSVRTSGSSRFVAATPIEIGRDGIHAGNVSVNVNGANHLQGIKTDYDRWPLVGSLVRSIAESRYEKEAPQSNRIANRKIESEVGTEIQVQLDEQIGKATDQLSTMVLGPLGKLRLDPQVIDMQTTDQRLLARYRLAGDWQLAAFTPRPRAPKSSLMSVQIHQSAINNTLEQLVPRDEPMSIESVINRAAGMFNQDVSIPSDIPEGVTIQFARTRPITVEVEEGKVWVTMRIVRLAQGDRLDLTQFIVRAAYIPQVNGLQASLVRDGHLRISGPGMSMRERLPVRAIFNKVLAVNRPLPLTLPSLIEHPSMQGLAVSQLELRGGWIAVALSEENAPRIASHGETVGNRE